jgi:hypothetical protein
MSDMWTKECCPQCKASNWLNHGDTSDITKPDIDACKCWQCERRFFLDADEVKMMYRNAVAGWDGNSEPPYEYANSDDFLRRGALCVWGRKNTDDLLRYCEDE